MCFVRLCSHCDPIIVKHVIEHEYMYLISNVAQIILIKLSCVMVFEVLTIAAGSGQNLPRSVDR